MVAEVVRCDDGAIRVQRLHVDEPRRARRDRDEAAARHPSTSGPGSTITSRPSSVTARTRATFGVTRPLMWANPWLLWTGFLIVEGRVDNEKSGFPHIIAERFYRCPLPSPRAPVPSSHDFA